MDNKVINLKDLGMTYILIRQGGNYLIDGKLYQIKTYEDKQLTVKNIDDIRLVVNNQIIESYTNGVGIITPEEFREKENKLNREYFDDLEEEYEYKKFIRDWKPIYKDIQRISEPIQVEVLETCYQPENKYITNCFFNGDEKSICLFRYDRPTALLDIVKECFDSVGMEYSKGADYKDTMNQKIWTNSSHSCIEYVQAFGTYIFSNDFKNTRAMTGTLSDMEKRYQKDYENIKYTIISKYNMMFTKKAVDIDFNKIINKLNLAQGLLSKAKVNKTSIPDYNEGFRYLKEAKEFIVDYFKQV